MNKPIISFTGEYDWLSNDYPCPIVIEDGVIYNSVQHAYQAHRILLEMVEPSFDGLSIRLELAKIKDPQVLRSKARAFTTRPDWDKVKNDVMNAALEAKFIHNPEMTEKLLATRDRDLIEGNTWHDNYWGDCCCGKCVGQGKNLLGKLIMSIREELFEAADA